MTFALRILVVVGVLGVVSAVELLLRGAAATRWRLSLFLVFAGLAGAAFGVAADLVTSSISTAYFEIGKGLGTDPGLKTRIVQLGLQAGLSGGMIVGCVLVVAGAVGKSVPRVPVKGLLNGLRAPVLGAVLGCLIGSLVGLFLMPDAALGDLRECLASTEVRPFLVVWSTHTGIYGGAAIGTIVGAIAVGRKHRSIRPADPTESAGTTSP